MASKKETILLIGVLSGIATTLIALIPVAGDCLGCLGFVGAAMLAVWYYVDRNQVALSARSGVGLGILTCIVAALSGMLFDLFIVLLGLKPSWAEEVAEGMARGGQEVPEFLRTILEPPMLYLVVLGQVLLAGVIAGAIGGAIGARVFKAREVPASEEGDDFPEDLEDL